MSNERDRHPIIEEAGEAGSDNPRGVIRRHLVQYFQAKYPKWDELKVRREVAYAMRSEGIVGFIEGLEKLDNEMVRKNPDWDWYLRWFELVPPDAREGA